MTSIATNRAAIRVHYHAVNNAEIENKSFSRLSSGTRIIDAADDAAGLFVAGRMKAQFIGLERAILNAHDGISLVNTTEANLNEIRNMVLRMSPSDSVLRHPRRRLGRRPGRTKQRPDIARGRYRTHSSMYTQERSFLHCQNTVGGMRTS